MRDPRRWLIWVALAAAVGALVLGRGGTTVKAGPGFGCLTHASCAKGLRCYAVPKDDDPFATTGLCVEPCLDDLQCGAGLRCAVTGQKNSQLLPVAPGLEPGERVCLR